jgi:hypothetical protein
MKHLVLLSILLLFASANAQTDSVDYENMELVAIKTKNGKTFRIKKNRRIRVRVFSDSEAGQEPINYFGKYTILDTNSIIIRNTTLMWGKSDTISISGIEHIRAKRFSRAVLASAAIVTSVVGVTKTGLDLYSGDFSGLVWLPVAIIPTIGALSRKKYKLGEKWAIELHEIPE